MTLTQKLVLHSCDKDNVAQRFKLKTFSLHCNRINRVIKEVSKQPSTLLTYMRVSVDEAAFTPTHLVFLQIETHHYDLEVRLLHEYNN